MKMNALLSTILILPATSLLAQGQSEVEILKNRVDIQERRITKLENSLNRLTGKPMTKESSFTPNVAIIPKAQPVKDQREAGTEAFGGSMTEYTVVKGDVLVRIAKRHHTSVDAIKKATGMKSDALQIGQKLKIPSSSQAKTPKPQSKAHPTPAKKSPKPVESSLSSSGVKTHTVVAGDTFYGIARSYGINEAILQAANPNAKPRRLQIGQVLTVEKISEPTAQQPSSAQKKKVTPKPLTPKPTQQAKKAPAKKSHPAPKSKGMQGMRTVTVHDQMTYADFARKYGTTTAKVNELNGLRLSKNAMLAKGSELYIPAK